MLNLFRRAESIRQVLAKDRVKSVIDDFVTQNMGHAQGVIVIWATDGEVFCDTGGFSGDAEVIGTLEYIKHEVEHKGVPRR